LCDEEIHVLYSFPDVVRLIRRRMRWVGNVDCIEELKKHTGISGEPEGKVPLGGPTYGREGYIKMCF